jgi:hypothetical protein
MALGESGWQMPRFVPTVRPVSKHAIALVAAVFVTAAMSAAAYAAASAWPRPGRYAGPTSEQGLGCSANYGKMGCMVTFKVVDGGKRVTGFTTADGYNGMCHYAGTAPHFFQYLVKVPPMKVASNGSFSGTATVTVDLFHGTFRVKGRFASGKAHGTVTRIEGTPAGTCGSGASNPTTSAYLETFTAKRR